MAFLRIAVELFERDLDDRGQYEAFKAAYARISGRDWAQGREEGVLEEVNVANAYAEISGQVSGTPTNILTKYRNEYSVSIEDFAGEDGRVPHIRHFDARHQLEGFRPIGARVRGNFRFGVTLSALFHVAGLGRPAAVQAGAVPPLAIQLDTVGRVGDHNSRLTLAQQLRDVAAVG